MNAKEEECYNNECIAKPQSNNNICPANLCRVKKKKQLGIKEEEDERI
ncbi:hypothetical protein KKH82_02980 [Patescibacteria group bacterium]|nr:hypothetical protein [Patescibacteria group bacterium]